jgi:hypothetical protein
LRKIKLSFCHDGSVEVRSDGRCVRLCASIDVESLDRSREECLFAERQFVQNHNKKTEERKICLRFSEAKRIDFLDCKE